MSMADEATRKVALITGAGRGLGRLIALKLASNGFVLALTARTFEELVGTRRLSGLAAGDALIVLADLTSGEAPLQLFCTTMDYFGRIDVLINAAHAASPSASLLDLEDADQNRLLAVNLHAPIALARLACHPMSNQPTGGTIINFIRRGAGGSTPDPITAAADTGIATFAHSLATALRANQIKAAMMIIPASDHGPDEAATALAIVRAPAGEYPLVSHIGISSDKHG